jgi:hypothetical protein
MKKRKGGIGRKLTKRERGITECRLKDELFRLFFLLSSISPIVELLRNLARIEIKGRPELAISSSDTWIIHIFSFKISKEDRKEEGK